MKKKSFHKYLLCLLTGMLIVGSISVYAVTTIIDSKEVSYDNKTSKGSYDNVQLSIDELYQRYKDLSGEQDTLYTEKILNGADPVLGDGMIPITLDGKGNVKYANLYTPWYSYEEKRWANAVILVKSPSKSYKTGDTILEKDIESYFVWIPRYKYKIWNLAIQDGIQGTFINTKDDVNSIRQLNGKARLIDVVFENKNTPYSTTQAIGNYYTHPAFIAFDVNGLWVGKFETGYNQMDATGISIDTTNWTTIGAQQDVVASSRIIVKPNVYSWRNIKVGNIFTNAIQYEPNLKSHMMKNTEWGAIAYLSHSIYGIGNEISINNNSNCMTGYSAAANTDQSTYPGTYGSKTVTNDTGAVTQQYNTATGFLASTTGNITGIYDLSGGTWEYMASYIDGFGTKNSGITENDLSKTQYFDKYSKDITIYSYSQRILGDATGEMGPFYAYMDKDGYDRVHNGWYADVSSFPESSYPWFGRGGSYVDGVVAGQFNFARDNGAANNFSGSRLVLAV